MKLHPEKKQELEEQVEAFIRFGTLLDRRTRAYLVSALAQRLGLKLELETLKDLDDTYALKLEKSLSDFFRHPKLEETLQEHPLLRWRFLLDILFWFRQSFKHLDKKHPYDEDLQLLESWATRPYSNIKTQWPYLVNAAENSVNDDSFSGDFYRRQFKNSDLSEQKFEFLLKDLMADWDAHLQSRILQWQLQQIDKQKEEMAQRLEQKVEEIEKVAHLLGGVYDFLDPSWNLNKVMEDEEGFEIVELFHKYLNDEESLRKLVDLLGNLRDADLETAEEAYERTLVNEEEVRNPQFRSEIKGITLGKDLKEVLPQEMVLFSDPDLEWSFLQKYAEEQLLLRDYDDKLILRGTKQQREVELKTKKKKKGPFIVCVDTSGSMEGEAERLAKVICFAVLKMAAKSDRQAYVINFSTGIKTLNLNTISESLPELIQFLKMSFRGGTDISLALAEAIRQLETQQYRDADVLIISDFIMYSLSDDLFYQIEKQQMHFNTEFHSIVLSDEANSKIVEKLDHVWLYNPDEKGIVKEISKTMKSAF